MPRILNYKYLYFLVILVFFVALIFKDPFSERTLIPNLEPYPDTLHYVTPALGLIRGNGFSVNREGRSFVPSVPPLYSLSLIPFFLIKPDPRVAYYTNVFLALSSVILFWLILKRFTENKLTIITGLVLYITNYFIYWVPSLVMAENLILTLYLAIVWLMLLKPTVTKAIFTAVLAVAAYAVKYVNAPLSAIIVVLYIMKILSAKEVKTKKKVIASFLISGLFAYVLLSVFENVFYGKNSLTQFSFFINVISGSIFKSGAASAGASSAGGSSMVWFSISYIKLNLPVYIRALLGTPSRFLWDYTPIVPGFVGVAGLLGLLINVFTKKSRFISIVLLSFIFSSVIFLSTFYTHDTRYIYIAIPTLIIGLVMFLLTIENRISVNKNIIFQCLLAAFLLWYIAGNFTRIKSQISLNFRYAETPWNYISVKKTNEFFASVKKQNNKKPVLISALPPFFVDYYSNGNYTLLPLSYEQEFQGQKAREIIWGPNDYSDLSKLYKKYLTEGYDVYVSRSGLGNESYTNRDFNKIVAEFNTQLVFSGCFDQCNIYMIKLKEKNGQ